MTFLIPKVLPKSWRAVSMVVGIPGVEKQLFSKSGQNFYEARAPL